MYEKNDKIYNNGVSRESPLPRWLWYIANERIMPNDGHAQRKSQASHALACGTTVSRRIWRFPGAEKTIHAVFFQSQRNWRKVLNNIRQTENRFGCCYGKTDDGPC